MCSCCKLLYFSLSSLLLSDISFTSLKNSVIKSIAPINIKYINYLTIKYLFNTDMYILSLEASFVVIIMSSISDIELSIRFCTL